MVTTKCCSMSDMFFYKGRPLEFSVRLSRWYNQMVHLSPRLDTETRKIEVEMRVISTPELGECVSYIYIYTYIL